jgi:subtilisin family serine protease
MKCLRKSGLLSTIVAAECMTYYTRMLGLIIFLCHSVMRASYSYPARWKETISVAAVKKTSDAPVAYFSESNPQVDFAAIGVNVTSLQPGGGYQTMQGTSMAAPHVSGLIAALMTNGAYRNKTPTLRNDLAQRYAIDIAAKGKDTSTGLGFVTFLSQTEFDDFWDRYTGLDDQSSLTKIQAQAY